LGLVDIQHWSQLDADQERVEQVGAVQQSVVLQADAATAVKELLEVLVVVVKLVLGAQQRLDQLGIRARVLLLQRLDVAEAADPPRYVRRRERLALEGGDDAHHVLVTVRRDDRHAKLVWLK